MVLPVANKSGFPPEFSEKSRLCYYGHLFNSIEVNSSFYKVPMPATVAKWSADVPDNFRFTYKLWRDITHVKELAFRDEDVQRFMSVINSAGGKKGCLLVQFPPGLDISAIRQVERLLINISESDPDREWKVFLEFRKMFWYNDELNDLLEKYYASIVMHDKKGSGTDFSEPSGDEVYLRFHGPDGNYRGSYSDEFLYEYAQYIRSWISDGKTVYAYFNNTMGDAVRNLIDLNRYVNER